MLIINIIEFTSVRHKKRSKAMMTAMVRAAVPGPSAQPTAAELCSPARALLQEPWWPDQPLTLSVPEDASGQAVTQSVALAPALCKIVTTTAVSSSTPTTPRASTSAAPPATSTSAPAVPRSAPWQRKVREEKQRQVKEMGIPKKSRKPFKHYLCQRCGQPKTREYGHSRFRREHFCSRAEGCSVEDWLAEKRAHEAKQKERQQVSYLML